MAPIVSEADLDEVRSLSCAVIFFWVDWSIQARQSRTNVEQAMLMGQLNSSPIPYFVADVSDQSGELWEALRKWLQADDTATDQAAWSGSGTLLWVRSGRVIHQMIDPMNHQPTDIAAMTERVIESA